MKTNKLIIVLVLILGIGVTGCKKKEFGCTDEDAVNYNASAFYPDGSCEYEGSVVFWKDSTQVDVDILLDGVLIGSVTKGYSSAPGCSADGCVTFTAKSTSTYYFDIRNRSNGSTWKRGVSIKTNQCIASKI